ncbi:MAG: hypothetical protein QF489_03745 [Planctomycetota bacterium]|jgi:hypothetical protein|nr:hypothetical protein [Planctomycetota bacterium]
MKRTILVSLIVAAALGACSGKERITVTPFDTILSRSNYKDWYTYTRPNRSEYAWTLWNWKTQLAPAARLASADNKPLLLWLENGHPLGDTSTNGIARRAFWTDVSLNASLTKMVVGADDLQWLLDSEDEEGQLLDRILEQDDDREELLKSGGVVIASSNGRWLGSYSGLEVSGMKSVMDEALIAWAGLGAADKRLAELTTMVSKDRPANLFPTDGLTLEIHRRPLAAAMDPAGERTTPWTHDYLWLSKSEIAPLVVSRLGQELEVPARQAQRFAQAILVDNLYSDGQSFALEDLQVTKLSMNCISKIGDAVRFTISGEFKAENDERGMHCFVEGDGSLNLSDASIPSLYLAAHGQSWGHSVEMNDDGTARLLTIALRRVNTYEGSHLITPSQFDQYPADWCVSDEVQRSK